MQPDPAVEEQPVLAASAPEEAGAEQTDPAGASAKSGPRPRSLIVWLAAAAALILVLGGGAYFLLRPAAPPASIEALRDLLVNPTDRDSTVALFPYDATNAGAANSPITGSRWAVQREWLESAEHTGYVLLMQFDTADLARSSLDFYRQGATQDGAHEQAVPDRADAFLYTLPAAGDAKTSGIGIGRRGTIVAILGSSTETPDYVQSLLRKQLDLLP